MRGFLRIFAAVALAAQFVVFAATIPAIAISADLAKKCRDMAIKSHPPPSPPGNKAYAQAERDFFNACVAKNGRMDNDGAPKNSAAPK